MTVRELARRPLVVPRRGYDVRETTLQAFADAGVEPRFAVEGGEMDAVLRMVEAGTGVAVVPDLVFAGRPRLRRTVLTPPLFRTVALARRADLAPTHAMRAFRGTLLSFLAVLSAGDGSPATCRCCGRPSERRAHSRATFREVGDADIHFYFDPVCPFAWMTSKWVRKVQAQRDYRVDWRFISLRLLNATYRLR